MLRCDRVAAQRLLEVLPAFLHIDSWRDDEECWIHEAVRLIARGAAAPDLGGETMITRLADILVVQTLRSWLDRSPDAEHGGLAALRDPYIGRVLTAVQRLPARAWTLPSLAEHARM